jgi:DNA transformation protein
MTRTRKRTSSQFAAYVLDQMHEVRGVSLRAMFGGHGVYCRGHFIALIWQDSVFMFTDENTRKKYKRAQMPPFEFKEGQKESNYFMLPDTVLDNAKKLATWVNEAVEARQAFDGRKIRK